MTSLPLILGSKWSANELGRIPVVRRLLAIVAVIRRYMNSFFLLPSRDVETSSSEEYDLPALKNIYKNETLAGKDMSRLLDAVFKTYDKRIRPFYDGRS